MPVGSDLQQALNIGFMNASDLDKLAAQYESVMDFVEKNALSVDLKNKDYQGTAIKGGTLLFRRLQTAASQPYGTARAAGEGDRVINDGIELKIDTDREIVEEIENKDARLYGVASIMQKRAASHMNSMVRELDRAFFVAAQTAAETVDVTSASTIQDKLELLIQDLETAVGDHVDGVNREDMVLTLSPYWYGQMRNYVDTLPNPAEGGVPYKAFHGVRVESSQRQGVDALLMFKGAVAQPVVVDQYTAEKINLSNAFAVQLFYSYGTKAIMPDLIRKAGLDGNISI